METEGIRAVISQGAGPERVLCSSNGSTRHENSRR